MRCPYFSVLFCYNGTGHECPDYTGCPDYIGCPDYTVCPDYVGCPHSIIKGQFLRSQCILLCDAMVNSYVSFTNQDHSFLC